MDKQMSLLQAASTGHEAVVKLLLEAGKADVNMKDPVYERTPLLCAAENGHEAVVKLLLEKGDVDDVDAKDQDERTPLSRAAENGHEAVVKLLLGTGKVVINMKDSYYKRTPLLWATKNGHEAVVKLLLEKEKVEDIDAKDQDERTPLSWAAENGHEAVVKLLLEKGKVDININAKDSSYHKRTPLLWATKNRHEAVVKLLLKTGKVNVRVKDQYKHTPLSWAAKNRHEAVVDLLLETGKVDLKDLYRHTPLSTGSKYSVRQIVNATRELVLIFQEDKDLAPLYKTAILIRSDRLQRDLHQIFKSYAKRLKGEVKDSLEYFASRLVLLKSKSLAESIVQKLKVSATHKRECKIQAVKDKNSDEERTGTVSDNRFHDFVPFREFLMRGDAFEVLRSQIKQLGMPQIQKASDTQEAVAGETCAEKSTEPRHKTQSNFYRSISMLKQCVDWLLIVAGQLAPPLEPKIHRLRWQCRCGETFFGDLKELREGGIVELIGRPKRTCGELQGRAGQAVEGWGIYYKEGWEWNRIASMVFVVFILVSLLF